MKRKKGKHIFLLQLVVMVYTLATVAAKFAAGYKPLSKEFILFYGIELVILVIYAILWQQIIKRMDLSIAYANKAFGIFWTLLWAILFFKEAVTWKNILGIVVVFSGIMVVNSDEY